MENIINNKIVRVIINLFKFLFFSLIILYLIFIVLQQLTNNSSIMGWRIFNVASASMDPVYKIGDVIVVKEVSVDSLKIGDDITYLSGEEENSGMLITHRIVRVELNEDNNRVFFTKGINNDIEDPEVNEEQVYGKVYTKLKLISIINRLIRNIYGFFFLVFVPLVLVIFIEILDTFMDYKQSKRDDYSE